MTVEFLKYVFLFTSSFFNLNVLINFFQFVLLIVIRTYIYNIQISYYDIKINFNQI